jgi:hypothetical protein
MTPEWENEYNLGPKCPAKWTAVMDTPFTEQEVLDKVHSIFSGKAGDLEGMTNELLKPV